MATKYTNVSIRQDVLELLRELARAEERSMSTVLRRLIVSKR